MIMGLWAKRNSWINDSRLKFARTGQLHGVGTGGGAHTALDEMGGRDVIGVRLECCDVIGVGIICTCATAAVR